MSVGECSSANDASGRDRIKSPILNMELDMRTEQGYVILTALQKPGNAARTTDVDQSVSPLKDLLNKASQIH